MGKVINKYYISDEELEKIDKKDIIKELLYLRDIEQKRMERAEKEQKGKNNKDYLYFMFGVNQLTNDVLYSIKYNKFLYKGSEKNEK